MNLDRKTFQIPRDHQHQFQIFLVHPKHSSSTLLVTFLSETNPPIHQKIPPDVSSCTEDAETGFGMDVFCNGVTTVPEGNNGTLEGAMVS